MKRRDERDPGRVVQEKRDAILTPEEADDSMAVEDLVDLDGDELEEEVPESSGQAAGRQARKPDRRTHHALGAKVSLQSRGSLPYC